MLATLQLEKDRLIIFTSDNGPSFEGAADLDFFDNNAQCRGYKRDLYEGGIQIPTIAKWPSRIKAGTKTNHISAFWDVLPTLAELTGFSTNLQTGGISFLLTLTDTDVSEKNNIADLHPNVMKRAKQLFETSRSRSEFDAWNFDF